MIAIEKKGINSLVAVARSKAPVSGKDLWKRRLRRDGELPVGVNAK